MGGTHTYVVDLTVALGVLNISLFQNMVAYPMLSIVPWKVKACYPTFRGTSEGRRSLTSWANSDCAEESELTGMYKAPAARPSLSFLLGGCLSCVVAFGPSSITEMSSYYVTHRDQAPGHCHIFSGNEPETCAELIPVGYSSYPA